MAFLSQTRLFAARVGRQSLTRSSRPATTLIARIRFAHTKSGTTGDTTAVRQPRHWRMFSATSAALVAASVSLAYLLGQRTPLALEPEHGPLANLPLDTESKPSKPRLVILGSGWGVSRMVWCCYCYNNSLSSYIII
jgi:hypothetical protein